MARQKARQGVNTVRGLPNSIIYIIDLGKVLTVLAKSMIELSKGIYTKEQLFTLTKKTDLSNIKRDLTKQGYRYYTNGRKGNNFRLEITAIPQTTAAAASVVSVDVFRKCCIDELSISKNADFNKLALLVCFLEYDTNFVDLTQEQMETRIKETGFNITRKTIAKYLEVFEKNNILVSFPSEYVYYVPLDKARFITRKEWCNYWKAKYSNRRRYLIMLKQLGKEPKRRIKREFGNALVPCYFTLVESAKAIAKEIVSKC